MSDSAYTWRFKAEGGQEASLLFRVIERLDKILARLTQREADVSGAFRSMGSASRTAAESTRTLRNAVAEVTKETVKTANGMTNVTIEYDRMGNVIRQTVDDVNTLGKTTTKSRQIFDGQGNVIKKTSETIEGYTEKIEKAAKSTKKEGNETGKATRKKQGLFKALTKGAGIWNTWNKAVDFAGKRIRQLYTGFTALFSKVQEIGGAFERSRATMEVLAKSSGATQGEIEALTTRTKDLGRTTEYTAQQSADGAITLLKAGETASSAWHKLGTALDGALATGLKVDKVAAIGNHAIKIFGDNLGKVGNRAHDYGTAMRVMIASANAAEVTVTQLDASLVKGGDILARLGVPLTRVNTALGIMAAKGPKGAQAMRMLSIGTKRLVDGTRPAAAALKELGVTVIDDAGNFRDLGAVMQDLDDALDLRRPNEQVKLMKELFGAADKAMGSLLDAGVQGFDKLENKILGALDVMDELKEARADTMVGSYKQFQSALDDVYIELTEILGIPIKEFWQTLANILNIVSDRIIEVGKRFNESGAELADWVNAIKSGSFNGIFDGLSGELSPEIQTLKTLFKGLVDIVVNLFKNGLADAAGEIWDTLFTDDVQEKAIQFGTTVGEGVIKGILATGPGKLLAAALAVNVAGGVASTVQTGMGVASMIGLGGGAATTAATGAALGTGGLAVAGGLAAGAGVALGVGYAGGKAAEYGIEKASEADTMENRRREAETLTTYLEQLLQKKKEIAETPIMQRTRQEVAALPVIREQIVQVGNELRKLGDVASGANGFPKYAKDVAKAKQELGGFNQEQKEVVEDTTEEAPKFTKEQEAWMDEYEKYNQGDPAKPGDSRKRAEKAVEGGAAERDTKKARYAERARAKMDEYKKRGMDERTRIIEYSKKHGIGVDEAKRQLRIDDAMERAQERSGRKERSGSRVGSLGGMEDEQIKDLQGILSEREKMIDAEKRQKEAIEQTNAVLHETQIEINNAGTSFQQWLLNPVDVFQQKINGIKEQFGGMADALRGKAVDVAEKFGLKTPEAADKKRVENVKKSLERDKELMKTAQTPEEEAKIQERMGAKAEKLAGLSEGQQQKAFAKQAEGHYGEAEEATGEAEELRIKEQEIAKEGAKENLKEYESLAKNAKTAGSRAAYQEQLAEAYKMLGPEYREKAVQAQAEFKKAKTESGVEQSENFKRLVESGELQVELLQRAVDALEGTAHSEQERMRIPIDQEFAEAS